jgi:hypothetical protein
MVKPILRRGAEHIPKAFGFDELELGQAATPDFCANVGRGSFDRHFK